MADHMLLEGFRMECVIGDYPEEREHPQVVLFDIDISGDFSDASCSDDIVNALDYTAVEALVIGYVPETSFKLVESLAAGIADLILSHFPLAQNVTVTIRKEKKVLKYADVTLRITRSRFQKLK